MNLFLKNKTFWEAIEADFCYKIPKYIKNVLTFCNFANVLSLQQLDSEDITKIQNMIRGNYKKWLEERFDFDFLDYFGPLYEINQDEFHLSCGDVKMIQQIAEHVRLAVQRNGYKHFNMEKREIHSDSEQPEIGFDGSDDIREQLYVGIRELLEPYDEEIIAKFSRDMVEVTNEDGIIRGRVRCILCNNPNASGSRKKQKTQTYAQYWKKDHWILSNFSNGHLKAKHPIPDTTTKIELVTDNTETIEQSNDEVFLKDKQLVKTDGVNVLTTLESQLQIYNIRLLNKYNGFKDFVECEVNLCDGKTAKILVLPIPADGNCLFAAIAHQRFHLKIDSAEFKSRVDSCRKDIVAHITEYSDRYERDILGRVQDQLLQKNQNKKVKFEDPKVSVATFLNTYLSKDGRWGGTESIRAAAELFKINIIIFNENGDMCFGNSFDPSFTGIITLAFRVCKNVEKNEYTNVQRNHYDSVIGLGEEMLKDCTAILIGKYQKWRSIKEMPNTIEID